MNAQGKISGRLTTVGIAVFLMAITSLLPAHAQDRFDFNENTYLQDTFQSPELDTTLWTPQGDVTVVSDDADDYALSISAPDGGSISALCVRRPLQRSDVFEIRTRLKRLFPGPDRVIVASLAEASGPRSLQVVFEPKPAVLSHGNRSDHTSAYTNGFFSLISIDSSGNEKTLDRFIQCDTFNKGRYNSCRPNKMISFPADEWHDFRVLINNSTGYVHLFMNGEELLSFSESFISRHAGGSGADNDENGRESNENANNHGNNNSLDNKDSNNYSDYFANLLRDNDEEDWDYDDDHEDHREKCPRGHNEPNLRKLVHKPPLKNFPVTFSYRFSIGLAPVSTGHGGGSSTHGKHTPGAQEDSALLIDEIFTPFSTACSPDTGEPVAAVPPRLLDFTPISTSRPEFSLPIGSSVGISSGNLMMDYGPPTVKVMGANYAPRLIYNSATVDPSHLIEVRVQAPDGEDLPETFSLRMSVSNGQGFSEEYDYVFDGSANEDGRLALLVGGHDNPLPTGIYDYTITATNDYLDDTVRLGSTIGGSFTILNNGDSPYGRGWAVSELQRLYPALDGRSIMFVSGATSRIFHENGDVELQRMASELFGTDVPDPDGEERIQMTAGTGSLAGSIFISSPFAEAVFRYDVAADALIEIGSLKSPGQPAAGTIDGTPVIVVPDTENNTLLISDGNNTLDNIDNNRLRQRVEAALSAPVAVAFAGEDILYVANSEGDTLVRIDFSADPNNAVTTLPGVYAEVRALVADPATAGNLETVYAIDRSDTGEFMISSTEVDYSQSPAVVTKRTVLSLDEVSSNPVALSLGEDGLLYLLDTTFESSHAYRIDPSDSSFNIYVDNFGPGHGLAAAPGGAIYSARFQMNDIVSFVPGRLFRSYPGDCSKLVKSDDGTYTQFLKCLTKLHYSEDGLITTREDKNSNSFAYTYDAENKLSTINDPVGQIWTVSYGTNGKIEMITGPSLRKTLFSHIEAGIEQISFPDNSLVSFSFDQFGRIQKKTNQLGYDTLYYYDETGAVGTVNPPGYGEYDIQTVHGNDILNNLTETGSLVYPVSPPDPDYSAGYTDLDGHSFTYEVGRYGELLEKINPDGGELERIYDENQNVIITVNRHGVETYYDYSGCGDLLQKSNHSGGYYTYEYNDLHLPTKITDPLGNSTFYTYDDNGNLMSSTDALGNTEYHTYYSNGLPKTFTNKRSFTTTYTYNVHGNLETMTDPISRTTYSYYDSFGNISKSIDPKGYENNYVYDVMNRQVKEIDAQLKETLYEYNKGSQIISITKSGNRITSYEYDDFGRRILTTDPEGNISKTTYGVNKKVEIDPIGKTKITFLDFRGNPTKEILPDDLGVLFYSYSESGQLLEKIEPNGSKSSNEYDKNGDLISMVDKCGNTTTYDYDLLGNIVKEESSMSGISYFEYDDLYRNVRGIEPDGNEMRYIFDENSNMLEKSKDGLLDVIYDYDEVERKISRKTEIGERQFFYDDNDNLTKMIDEDGNVIEKEYDELNRLTILSYNGEIQEAHYYDEETGFLRRTIDKDGKETVYSRDGNGNASLISVSDGTEIRSIYDGNGNLTERSYDNGFYVKYTYDALEQLLGKDYPGNDNDINYVYDLGNNLINISNNVSSSKYTYSSSCDIIEHEQNIEFKNKVHTIRRTFEYDSHNIIKESVNIDGTIFDQGSAEYEYNQYHQLIASKRHFGEVHYSYDYYGNTEKIQLPNGISQSFNFEGQRFLKGYTIEDHNSDIVNMEIIRDEKGRILKKINQNGEIVFDFDNSKRIKRIIYDGYDRYNVAEEHYTYDASGNRSEHTKYDKDTTLIYSNSFQYDNNSRLIEDDYYEYTFDSDGNLVEKKSKASNEVIGYDYDIHNNLKTVTFMEIPSSLPSKVIEYEYDWMNRRIAKNSDDITTLYFYSGSSLLATMDLDGNILEYYHNEPVFENWPISIEKGESILFPLYSENSTIDFIVNSAGVIVSKSLYDPFGNMLFSYGRDDILGLSFLGRQWDNETGLYYFMKRDYDPQTGRFIQYDPITNMVNHPYGYADNDPIHKSDEHGYQSEEQPGECAFGKSSAESRVDNETIVQRIVVDPCSPSDCWPAFVEGCHSEGKDGDGNRIPGIRTVASADRYNAELDGDERLEGLNCAQCEIVYSGEDCYTKCRIFSGKPLNDCINRNCRKTKIEEKGGKRPPPSPPPDDCGTYDDDDTACCIMEDAESKGKQHRVACLQCCRQDFSDCATDPWKPGGRRKWDTGWEGPIKCMVNEGACWAYCDVFHPKDN